VGGEYGWGEWQKYGAQGLPGGEALMREIERVAREGGIASPAATGRGLAARLRYLASPAGREVLHRHGVSDRLLRAWAAGRRASAPKRDAVDAAYQERRRANLLRSGALTRLLDNDGRGRRIEVYPVDQTYVPEARRRPNLSDRSIQARYVWDDAVRAWAGGDRDTMDEIWDDLISDLDSDYGAYAYVAALGIGA
jgi:hypothetical protein